LRLRHPCQRQDRLVPGAGEGESNKRRPPVRISDKLLPHLRRWRAMDQAMGIQHVVTFRAGRIKKLRTSWERARDYAGLGPEVTPHILKHTRATWLMHAGVDIAEAAGSVGTTVATFEAVYGHHHPDFQRRAAAV
jgi:integrase